MGIFRTILKIINHYPVSYALEDFNIEYSKAPEIVYHYLGCWFSEIFELPEYKSEFGNTPDMAYEMASACSRYIFFMKDSRSKKEIKNNPTIQLANNHVYKWVNDAMDKDLVLREFVVQTLRMKLILQGYMNKKLNKNNYSETPEGLHIQQILLDYGESINQEINPRNYTFLYNNFCDIITKMLKSRHHES